MDPKPVEGEEQAKKRRGRKKSKLEDMFPTYLQVCNLSMLQIFLKLMVSSDMMFMSQIFVSLQEAFFGKTLIDLSKKAVMIPPGQRLGACLVRPSLPAPSGLKPTAPESKITNLTCDTRKLCRLFVTLGVEKVSTWGVTFCFSH